jgi:HD-GYP domain-containing protein (c-di-GMP phosphodiesterase class II)
MPTIEQQDEQLLDGMVKTLMRAAEMRDPLTDGHSKRVTAYSLLIADAMSISADDRLVLRYAAMMHDLGKLGVPEAILWKENLSPAEQDCVQTHAKLTYELLSGMPFTNRLAQVPLVASCHLEKLDGSGYYRSLKGEDIPVPARIITICNRFDELTAFHHGCIIQQEPRMSIREVYETLESGRGSYFDPQVLDCFYGLRCDQVLKVMESERGHGLPDKLDAFQVITFYRLVELFQGAQPTSQEEDLQDTFFGIYNSHLRH